MRRILYAAVVLLCCSSANAQWGVTLGPGINPEMDTWYSRWSTVQNGRLCHTYTPATVGQCRQELYAIMSAYPPVQNGLPFPYMQVTYHPAYSEARHCLDWMWMWDEYRP